MTKANLVLPDGTTVNIEGTVDEVALLLEKISSQETGGTPGVNIKKKPKKKGKKVTKGARTPKISSDLDLSGGKKGQSLRDFFSQYEPSSNLERNLVFVYYLKQIAGIELVTIDHIFTCYRNIKDLKVPIQLQQSLIDTRTLKGWIDPASLDDIKLNVPGINHLEHDMKNAEDKDAGI
jgi:hypothetical protein